MLFTFILNVVMLRSVFILDVIMLSVFRLSVVLIHIIQSGFGWTFPNISAMVSPSDKDLDPASLELTRLIKHANLSDANVL
jgi:hypothetical protein